MNGGLRSMAIEGYGVVIDVMVGFALVRFNLKATFMRPSSVLIRQHQIEANVEKLRIMKE